MIKTIFECVLYSFDSQIYKFVHPESNITYYLLTKCRFNLHFYNGYPKIDNHYNKLSNRIYLNQKYLALINNKIMLLDHYDDDSDYTYCDDLIVFN